MTGKHGEATNRQTGARQHPALSGKEVTDARPDSTIKNTSMVSLSLTPRGALFEMATGEHVGKRLAIVLDGTIHRSVIQGKDRGRHGQHQRPVHARRGAGPRHLPAFRFPRGSGPLLEQRTVGPALGEASITSGILAALIGTLAVMIIMPLRYGWSGMLANGCFSVPSACSWAVWPALGATLTPAGHSGRRADHRHGRGRERPHL